MTAHRPFPPSPRRRALAHRAGLHAGSAIAVGAHAAVALVVGIAAIGGASTAPLGDAIARACRAAAGPAPQVSALDPLGDVLAIALPLLVAAALAAIAAHVAQVRALWLPRRSLPGAPALDRSAGARTRAATIELARMAAIGALAVGWLWACAPRLAALPTAPLAGAALVLSACAAFAIAWVVAGAVDAIARHAAVAHALRMTAAEHREDARLAGADPRCARRRRELAAASRHAIAEATVVIVGDDCAVAIAWDPVRRPIPTRLARGRGGPRVVQLLGLARQYGIAVHRDDRLARTLVAIATDAGRVPDAHWGVLAQVVAAVRGR